ncbi:MAG: hypothetical protein HY299_09850 [Verrucomicrobia bacterium]|nr:hypothetical protein [Verrucomicrobiota bacterium]
MEDYPPVIRFGSSLRKHVAVETGLIHDVTIPPEALRRYVWIACDIFDNISTCDWFIEALITFYRNGQPLCSFPLYSGNVVVPGQAFNIFAPSVGAGSQPGLQAQGIDSVSLNYKKLDLPCFEFWVEADRLVMEIKQMSRGSATLRDLCTGFVVLSQEQ